ncbi:30S ribosome-binding factor RbfA [Gammaproteobacteria bacterium]|nr:30S ribosome-binding factor RbfA [Gammaproteobacteria bacterium]
MIEKKRRKAFNSMSSTRVPKIEDFLKKEISQIISSQVKDPRYKFLNIVDVKCSSDLGVAKVFYTIINGDISDSPDKQSIEKFSSMVRSKLSKFMQIRRVPKLIFKYDESLERYNNIDALLNSLSD